MIESKDFAEKLEMFLSTAWIWGDRQRAGLLLDTVPELSSGNIFAACAAADSAAIAYMLEADPALATATGGPRDWSPILYATWSCFLSDSPDAMVEVVQRLIDHGADPNSYWINETDWKEVCPVRMR